MSTLERKVFICTLSKAMNYGAYLQAYALQESLKSIGLIPYMIDIYDFPQQLKRLRSRISKKPDRAWFNARLIFEFLKAEKKMKFSPCNDGGFDAVFVGSDEVWNITNKSFLIRPEFYGLNLGGIRRFSYAPSVGNASKRDFVDHPNFIKGIQNFDRISVRDENTRKFVSEISPAHEVSTVLDPTFIHDFSKDEKPFEIKKPYIVVYSYGMTDVRRDEITHYARKHNLLLVSPGNYNPWCDLNIPCSPFEFLGILKNSSAVITNTFHGTVFSIIYRKDFISYSAGKSKIQSLLKDLRLDGAAVSDFQLGGMDEITTSYEEVEPVLRQKIEASKRYLIDCRDLISE